MEKRPFIIDCDTGTDDAIGIVAALNTPGMDIRAITTVAGNVDLCYTAPNTLNLVRMLGFDVKVAKGSPCPIYRVLKEVRAKPAPGEINTHGDTGFGDVYLPECGLPFYEKNAVETIYEEAVACGGELEIIAVGPLTNIAHALMTYPELKEGLIKHITFMGGAAKGGNTTAVAEFNILCDPEAAHIVLHSGIPCTMVGLDVTERAAVSDADCDFIRTINTPDAQIVADLLDFMRGRRDEFGGEDTLMHDALAIAAAILPGVVDTKMYYVDAECAGKYTFGHTFVAFDNRLGEFPPNCNVALDVHMDIFTEWLKKAVAKEL
ncbi:MAG: nucleoside hydrolase [Oscillospiraceae bacterium]|nr:nucleoside hydrolase [Oscillospiraceae bacterium]